MGNTQSTPSTAPSTTSISTSTSTSIKPSATIDTTLPKCKPCCACPDTRKARDECVFENGEENCSALIIAHQECMRAQGFNI